MNVLFFGDIVGRPGRVALQTILPGLREEFGADLVIANAENAAHGFGITPDVIDGLRDAGVDLFTAGNHVWKNVRGVELLDTDPDYIAVPANYVQKMPGRELVATTVNGAPVVLINLIGQAFTTDDEVRSPFDVFDQIYREHGMEAITIVDLHAEATGEKRCFSWYVDGRATLVVGTHTHVPTADEQIMPKGTGYITDLGMCGAVDSSIGMNKQLAIKKVAQQIEIHLEPPTDVDSGVVQGVAVNIDETARKAVSIERIDRIVAL
ncbi:MAG: TIGR00282 family metallophosphoesterase [Candidatus Kerfeldbacteria bacterium]